MKLIRQCTLSVRLNYDNFGFWRQKNLEKVIKNKREISRFQAKLLAILFNLISPELAWTSQSFL